MTSRSELASSIRVVSNRTGIGPHTLRVWERRYGFPSPMRRADGVRTYSEADVAKLKLVVRALEAGFRAGEVVPLPSADLERLLEATGIDFASTLRGGETLDREGTRHSATTRDTTGAPSDPVARILAALVSDDIVGVHALLQATARELGPKKFVTDLAHPLALRVGELWERKELDVRHEHLVSACLTRRLQTLQMEDAGNERRPVVVLATLPGEHHLLPLDMVAVYLSASDAAPRMLGADTPPREIAASALALNADVVGISVSAAADTARARDAIRELLDDLPRRMKLWLGGAGSAAVFHAIDERGVAHIASWEALDEKVDDIRAGRAA